MNAHSKSENGLIFFHHSHRADPAHRARAVLVHSSLAARRLERSRADLRAAALALALSVGLALFALALRRQNMEYAMLASPLLSPYVVFHSWAGTLLGIVTSVPETIAAVIGLWIPIGMRDIRG